MSITEYRKTKASICFSVRTFVTFYHRSLSGQTGMNEAHDFPELVFVERGVAPLYVGGEYVTLREGQMMVYAPGTFHSRAGTFRDVMMDNCGFEGEPELPAALYDRVITLDDTQRRTLSRIMIEGASFFRRFESVSPYKGMALCEGVRAIDVQRLKNQLELFFLDLIERETASGAVGKKKQLSEEYIVLRSYIDDNLRRRLTLEEIAGYGRISVSKLKQLFHSQCGSGVVEFITSRRVETAKKLIDESSMNFTQIAEASGFGTVHYFSRVFKKQTGFSPTEYRSRRREHRS